MQFAWYFFYMKTNILQDFHICISVPLIAFVCFYSLTGSSSPRCTFIKLKACNQIPFFTLDFNYICDYLVSFYSSLLCRFHTISKFKRINNKSFHRILLILPGGISLNPGPVYNSQSSCSNEWNVFKAKGIHQIYLNVNSLLPNIDESRYITALLPEYLNLSLMKPFFSRKSKYLTMSCSDVIGTETVKVSLEVISVTYKHTFFRRKSKIFLLKFFFLKPSLKLLKLFIDLLIKVTFLKL